VHSPATLLPLFSSVLGLASSGLDDHVEKAQIEQGCKLKPRPERLWRRTEAEGDESASNVRFYIHSLSLAYGILYFADLPYCYS